jgi:hypothetical protein
MADVSIEGSADVSDVPPKLSAGARDPVSRTLRGNGLWLFVVVALAGAVLIIAVLIALRETAMEPATIGTELTAAFMQLAVVAVGGAVIAAIVKIAELDRETRERKAERDRDQQRKDFESLLSMFRDISNTYNRIKSVNRSLTAANLKLDPPNLDRDQSALVKQQMDVLNEAQLSLETMMRVVRVRHGAFKMSDGRPVYAQLTYCLRQMEGYVNDVVKDTRRKPSSMLLLAKFLGPVNGEGGIREGGRVHAAKDSETEWKEAGSEPGNGPTAHLRHIEHIIAEAIPGGSPIPAVLMAADDAKETADSVA